MHRRGTLIRRTALLATTAALALGAAVGAGVLSPAVAEAPATDWVDVGHEHVSGQDSYLYDSWASGDESWHVGTRRADFGGVFEWRNLVQRCVAGSCTPTYPNDVEAPPYTYNQLQGISGTSTSNVWAVGWSRYPGQPSLLRPTAHRWNGSSWQLTANPVASGALWDVSAKTADDVWAVGSDNSGTEKPLVMRWNGGSWSVVPFTIAGPCTPYEYLRDVDATGRYPIVLGRCRPASGPTEAMIATYRNGAWKRVDPPGLDATAVAYDAVAWVGKQAWVGGYKAGEALAVRLKKKTWTVKSGATAAQVYGIAGSSPRDVWAVGHTSWPTRYSMHWDGKTWTQVDAGSEPGPFQSVAILGDGTPWAAGQRLGQSMIARYTGSVLGTG